MQIANIANGRECDAAFYEPVTDSTGSSLSAFTSAGVQIIQCAGRCKGTSTVGYSRLRETDQLKWKVMKLRQVEMAIIAFAPLQCAIKNSNKIWLRHLLDNQSKRESFQGWWIISRDYPRRNNSILNLSNISSTI